MSGPSLRALQEWLATVTTDPDGVSAGAERARRLVSEMGGPVDIGQVVRPGPRLSAHERLEIYHRAYRARLVECLLDDYPALAHALGPEAFERVCHAYIAAHPSRSPSLNGYGRHLAAFCSTRTDPWRAFAADLADLEWAIVEAIHAPAAGALSLEALQSVPPERWGEACFHPNPGVRLLRFEHPVNAYYQAFQGGEGPEIPSPDPSALAVYRRGFTVWRMDLTPAMAAVLEALFTGTPLAEALLTAAAATETSLTQWFQTWIESGFFARVDFGEASYNQP